jgi:hypothetical protein
MTKKLLFAIFLGSISAVAAAAQSNPEQAVINAQEQVSDIKKRSIELERMKRESNKRSVGDNLTQRFPEIKEDFEEIQKINANVLKLTTDKTAVNYSAVLKSVTEIKRRAVRLRSNLFSPEPEENNETKNEPQNTAETQDVKILFAALDKSIDSFVHSSIFKNINLVNSDDSLKAQKDLEEVIRISTAIRAKTKKLAQNDPRK